MNYTLKDHGDFIEQRNATFITSQFPSYEVIWSAYIGNDGSARLPVISNMTPDHQVQRSKFSEAHYTCLESIIGMKRIEEKTRLASISNDYDTYIDLINDFTAFHANAGRIYDAVSQLLNFFFIVKQSRNKLKSHLDLFWESRNFALHRMKLPYNLVSGVFHIMHPIDGGELREKYYKQRNAITTSWGYNQTNPSLLIDVKQYYKDFLEALLVEVESILKALSVEVISFMNIHNYSLPAPPTSVLSTVSSASQNSQNGITSGSGSASLNNFGNSFRSGSLS